MAKQGSFPIVAPVNPYTEFALIYEAVGDIELRRFSRRLAYLKCKLSAIKHSPFKRVLLVLQISFCTLTSGDEVFQNSR